MAASIGFYDTDDTTQLATLDLGIVPPGSSYFDQQGAYREVRVKNDGDANFASVDIEIQQAGAYVGYTHLRVAPDAGGSAGAFQDYSANPLALGALAAAAVEPVWLDVVVPGGAEAEVGQVSNVVAVATV